MTEIDIPRGPELVFGLVGAVGTDLEAVTEILRDSLADVSYATQSIRLSQLLKQLPAYTQLRETPTDVRYADYMEAGSDLRERTGLGDAVAMLGVQEVQKLRSEAASSSPSTQASIDQQKHCQTCRCAEEVTPRSRTAYVLHSLKHPDEVATLRRIYGPGFILVAAYSPRDSRLKRLERMIADSRNAYPPSEEHTRLAEVLVRRDEKEAGRKKGQDVRGTFPMADVFIDASQGHDQMRQDIERFIALLFGDPFVTPTVAEHAMMHAQATAFRSAELGRQVGAAITSNSGELIAVGTNEVPKAFGGQYWPTRSPGIDQRDFVLGEDTSERMRRNNLAEVLSVLRDNNLLDGEAAGLPEDELLRRCFPLMTNTRLMNSIEFGRAVHAEMGAITEAAKRGVSLTDTILYTTTFPCHNCARHILAAGIRRVVYIEPYAKSLAGEFHHDSVAVEAAPVSDRQVPFVPFVGVAPRRYMTLFEMVQRKQEGKMVRWEKRTAMPRVYPPILRYLEEEELIAPKLKSALQRAGVTVPSEREKP